MAQNIETMNFRDLADRILLIWDIDEKTKFLIQKSEFKIRPDDNAMLVAGYIDREAGLSFEVLCSAYVYADGAVTLEPNCDEGSLKFRYGTFQGYVENFNDLNRLTPYKNKVERIIRNYDASDEVKMIRSFPSLDQYRAPGYPDDIMVFLAHEGYSTEGIWCRAVSLDMERRLIQMMMLNEPNQPLGVHEGDIVDVTLYPMENGEVRPVAIL